MTLSDLIASVERAEGPSREIDAAVAVHFVLIDDREASIGFRMDKAGTTHVVISPKVPRQGATLTWLSHSAITHRGLASRRHTRLCTRRQQHEHP